MGKMTNDEFLEKLKVENPKAYEELEFIGVYTGITTKIHAICKYGELMVQPNNILRGTSPTIASAINKHEYFLSKLKEVNRKAFDSLVFLEEYTTAKTNLLAKNKHGHVMVSPDQLLGGRGVDSRSAVNKTKYFVSMAMQKHANLYDYSNSVVINTQQSVDIVCKKCNKSFKQLASSHIQGAGCPKCRSSKGELKIANFLALHNIEFIAEKKFVNCKNKYPLPFDFYLPDFNCCIEYDGEFHFHVSKFRDAEAGYTNTKKRDFIKDVYCQDNRIMLIRIPYMFFNDIETILESKLLITAE